MGTDDLDQALLQLDGLINWERKDRSAGMQRSLEPIRELLERLGDPQRAWRGILVAGTKGKGSVASLLAEGLQNAGLRTGIYASPHVERVTERVRMGGEEVSRSHLAAALEEALAARAESAAAGAAGAEATWFDVMTAAAFLLFRQMDVAWAVVEVGIGGRLDSTRVIEAPLSVVTNVELEHTATLGPTRAHIAREKGAVIAQNGVLITGVQEVDEEPYGQLQKLARAAGGRLVSVPQRGTMGERNLALAEAALNELGRLGFLCQAGEPLWRSFLDDSAVGRARLAGRMEHFQVRGVPVVLDSGHVASSAVLLLSELERDPTLGRKPKLIIALGADKNARAVLASFVGHVDRCLCTSARLGSLLDEQALAEAAAEVGHEPEAWDDAREALGQALADAEEGGGWILIFGSFYLSSVLRPLLDRASGLDPHEREC